MQSRHNQSNICCFKQILNWFGVWKKVCPMYIDVWRKNPINHRSLCTWNYPRVSFLAYDFIQIIWCSLSDSRPSSPTIMCKVPKKRKKVIEGIKSICLTYIRLLSNCAVLLSYRVIVHVLPQSNDFSMYIAFGRNVLYVMIRWVTWNSASRSNWIVTFCSPFSACHHVRYWSILGFPFLIKDLFLERLKIDPIFTVSRFPYR